MKDIDFVLTIVRWALELGEEVIIPLVEICFNKSKNMEEKESLVGDIMKALKFHKSGDNG
jgi:hypothetical protein